MWVACGTRSGLIYHCTHTVNFCDIKGEIIEPTVPSLVLDFVFLFPSSFFVATADEGRRSGRRMVAIWPVGSR